MDIKLLGYAQLEDLSPGTAIASFDEKIYLVASDGSTVTILNKNWKFRESIPLSTNDGGNTQEPAMRQFHAATVVTDNKTPLLLLLGAGNESEIALLVNLKTQEKTEIDLSTFYEKIRQSGIETPNITGIIKMHDKTILCNSGGMESKDNRLIVTTTDFWKKPNDAEVKQLKIETEEEKSSIQLSSITYSDDNDWLIVTGSFRNNPGKSGIPPIDEYFTGVVEEVYRKSDRKRLKLNYLFELGPEDDIFNGQEIKSVCLQADKKNKLKLHLLASDDAGNRTFFKIRLKENN